MEKKGRDHPTIFVIDDDPDVREGMSALFESVGLACRTFGNAAEFFQIKRPDEPSCVIVDVRLPGISGLEFQAQLTGAKIAIPIVFITGHGDIPMTVKALKAGAIEFLTKPVREQELLDAVQAAIDRDRARRKLDMELADLRGKYEALSSREQEVMALVISGLMNKQAAAEIGISEITVKVHRHNVMKKLGARSLAELVRMADSLRVPIRKAN